MDEYGIPGYYNWDAIAAAYMLHPELFDTENISFHLSLEDLQAGKLTRDEKEKNAILKIPVIKNADTFCKNIYDTWKNVKFCSER